jgi:DNA-binding SARP family transcriptional activator/DNA-binding beta-propeller fold protein YncE
MDVNILGPFEVRGPAGRELRLPAGRERSLFVLLLIHRGAVVSNDRIVDALWGGRPPDTAGKAVQGYVSHLRRVLEPGRDPGDANGLLVTRPPGYALRTGDVTIDATRFERLAQEARRALEDGSAAEAERLLDEGLALWRGPALAEFAFDDFAQAEIDRLEELRLAATEDRIEASLQLGRHGEVVGLLAPLVSAHPLRERLRGQWMLALYRGGRQADALQAFRDGRRLLADQLGLEPGRELQRLERAILEQDPALEVAPPSTLPVTDVRGDGPPPSPARGRVRRSRLALGALLVLACAASALAAVLTRDDAPRSVKVAAPSVVAVDPTTNRIVASIPTGSKPASIAAGAHGVWVGDAEDGTVTRIDPATRKVVKTIGIGAPAVDLATGLGSVWAATGGFGTIVRIDPALGAVEDRIPLGKASDPIVPAASSIGVGDGRVWVGAFHGLVRIDPQTGKIVRRIDLGDSPGLRLAVGNDAVWASIVTRRAERVDAISGQITTEFYSGVFVAALAADQEAVWLAGGDRGQLWKIDPLTGSTLLTSSAGSGASAIALGAGSVWIASWPDRKLVRVDQGTGQVQAAIAIGGVPQAIVISDGLVWVAVQPVTS